MHITHSVRVASAVLPLAALVLAGSLSVHVPAAATAARPLSVEAALSLCRHHRVPARGVAVSGYFVAYSGPVLNGPMVLIGALFDSKAVPLSAVSSLDDAGALRRYHGLGFSVMNTSRVAYSPVILKIRNRSHLVVTGRLDCMGHGIRPTAIRLIAG